MLCVSYSIYLSSPIGRRRQRGRRRRHCISVATHMTQPNTVVVAPLSLAVCVSFSVYTRNLILCYGFSSRRTSELTEYAVQFFRFPLWCVVGLFVSGCSISCAILFLSSKVFFLSFRRRSFRLSFLYVTFLFISTELRTRAPKHDWNGRHK